MGNSHSHDEEENEGSDDEVQEVEGETETEAEVEVGIYWRDHAKLFLLSYLGLGALQEIHKKTRGKNSEDLAAGDLIDHIVAKTKTPQDLLKKQQITVEIIRNYLAIDRNTKISTKDLHKRVLETWRSPIEPLRSSSSTKTTSRSSLIPTSPPTPTPTNEGNKKKRKQEAIITTTSTTTAASTTSSEVAIKKKRESTASAAATALPAAAPTPKIIKPLNNWWKATNCVTETAYCTGSNDTGDVVVTPHFPNRNISSNSEVPGEGNIIYRLGNHSNTDDQVEDTFGPWPTKMTGPNAVNLQFRSLQSESVTDFSTRLGKSVEGTSLDHLSSSMVLFNCLKLINAFQIRKSLKKAVDGTSGCDATPFPADIISRLQNEFHIPLELINAVDNVEKYAGQLNAACSQVHDILYLKDKKQILQTAMNHQFEGENLSKQIYCNRLRSLDACEKRAAKCREETKLEKMKLENAKRQGLEAERRQQNEQNRSQLLAIEAKLEIRNQIILFLQGNAQKFERDVLEANNQIREMRKKMARAIVANGSVDHLLQSQHNALSFSKTGLEESLQRVNEQIESEEQSRQAENRQLNKLKEKIRLSLQAH